jgi:CRP/FNR family transcriptional regulator, cyclic AMP receptor protein
MAGRGRADKQLVERLQAVPLFSGCSTRELASLSQFLRVVEFPAGREIVKQGASGTGLHVLMEGETKVLVGNRTRQRLGPGDFFGEISLLDRGPRTATVVAETPVRTMSLSSWNFRAALKEHPSMAIKMLEELARRVRGANLSVKD